MHMKKIISCSFACSSIVVRPTPIPHSLIADSNGEIGHDLVAEQLVVVVRQLLLRVQVLQLQSAELIIIIIFEFEMLSPVRSVPQLSNNNSNFSNCNIS